MAAKQTSGYANSLLRLIFNAFPYPQVADQASVSPYQNLWVSLHTGSPGASGSQNTTEATYSAYTRVAVSRTGGGWVVTTNSVSPASTIIFPQSTAGNESLGWFGVGFGSGGAGQLIYFGTVSPAISVVGANITPELVTSSAITET